MTLPSTLEAPKPLRSVADTLAARERDLQAAQQRLREARAGVQAARREDVLAAAVARDHREPDPGPIQETRARTALAQAERDVEIETVRHGTAEDHLDQALAAHGDAWAKAVEQARTDADGHASAVLRELAEAEQRRAQLTGLSHWLGHLTATGTPPRKFAIASGATSLADPRNADSHLRADQLLAVLQDYLGSSTAAAERARVADRERQAVEDEQAAEEVAQMHRAWVSR